MERHHSLVHDRINAMGNSQYRAVFELLRDSNNKITRGVEAIDTSKCKHTRHAIVPHRSDCLLNKLVSFKVDRGRRLIEYEHFSFAKYCACETQQLTLANTEILT